jgi:hypothetical protein
MHNLQLVSVHLFATWLGLLAGVLSGAAMGLFFHREDWLGGYGSYPRRLIRLGHISFFGLGLLNALFALTIAFIPWSEFTGFATGVASIGLLTGAITMPLCCFLSAWRKQFRFLFPIPVGSLFVGTALVLFTLVRS